MLAEIFLVRIEMQRRVAAADTARPVSDARVVPAAPPRETPRKPA